MCVCVYNPAEKRERGKEEERRSDGGHSGKAGGKLRRRKRVNTGARKGKCVGKELSLDGKGEMYRGKRREEKREREN